MRISFVYLHTNNKYISVNGYVNEKVESQSIGAIEASDSMYSIQIFKYIDLAPIQNDRLWQSRIRYFKNSRISNKLNIRICVYCVPSVDVYVVS